MYTLTDIYEVSVPIRGLFNLTEQLQDIKEILLSELFPSPSGDYLI